jgi:hypothetical protein
MNSDGSNQKRLTNNAAAGDPNWSPDGSKIAFSTDRDNGKADIYVMNSDGSNQKRLTNNAANDYMPDWSPDGSKIAFATHRNSGCCEEIYVMNAADGSGQTNLSNNPAQDLNPSWSPDGTKIAFYSQRGGDGLFHIYVMNAADGSGQTRLADGPGDSSNPDWGTAPNDEVEDTTPPVITVPEDIIVDAATANGGTVVTYNVTAEDNVDGTAILEEDNTLTQDDVGGAIDISCDPPSGSEFPIGETIVDCTATDAAGNVAGPESFTVTVNPPPPPPPTPTTPREIIERLISDIENLEGIPEGTKTRIIALLERALALLNDDNTRNDASVCNIIGTAFMNQVNVNERQDTLTEDQAGDLRAQAQDIRDMLGC